MLHKSKSPSLLTPFRAHAAKSTLATQVKRRTSPFVPLVGPFTERQAQKVFAAIQLPGFMKSLGPQHFSKIEMLHVAERIHKKFEEYDKVI